MQKIGRTKTAVYLLSDLGGGSKIPGPAIIIDQTSTIVVEPDCEATISPDEGNIVIDILKSKEKDIGYARGGSFTTSYSLPSPLFLVSSPYILMKFCSVPKWTPFSFPCLRIGLWA